MIPPAPAVVDSQRRGGRHVVDFIYENLISNAVEGVDLSVNGNVWIGFDVVSLGSSISRCGFPPSKALVVVFH